MNHSARDLVLSAAGTLHNAGVPDADFDATELFLHVSGWDRANWLLHRNEPAPPRAEREYAALIQRRAAGEPLQYILGKQPFFDREFSVGPGVLIPRPETEELTQLCVEKLRERGKATVYDLCAGSGCIGMTVALACPGTDVYLFERSEGALRYLRKNNPPEAGNRLHVIVHDIFEDRPADLPAPDCIVSNPPYIPAAELPGLQREVREEPAMALDGGADGLDFYRRIAGYWLGLLKPDGFAAFECGEDQAQAVAAMLPQGFNSRILNDSFGAARFVFCGAFEKGS